MYIVNHSENDEPQIQVSKEVLDKWAKLQILYHQLNPHIDMKPVVTYKHHKDGDLIAELKGTNLSMRVSSKDWSWTE